MTCPVCSTEIYRAPGSDVCPECGVQIAGKGANFYAPLPLPVDTEAQRSLPLEIA